MGEVTFRRRRGSLRDLMTGRDHNSLVRGVRGRQGSRPTPYEPVRAHVAANRTGCLADSWALLRAPPLQAQRVETAPLLRFLA